jgi:hypothetical protein
LAPGGQGSSLMMSDGERLLGLLVLVLLLLLLLPLAA